MRSFTFDGLLISEQSDLKTQNSDASRHKTDVLFESQNQLKGQQDPLVASFASSHSEGWYRKFTQKKKFTVGIFGLGDVGGTMAIALATLGSSAVDELRLYDLNPNQISRYHLELNQIYSDYLEPITIKGISRADLFDCDVLVFTASAGVPPVGAQVADVRMVQLEQNAKIVSEFVHEAEQNGFKGLYAIVSDPVDLLCQVAQDTLKNYEAAPVRVKGFGLGVMFARARYFAQTLGYTEFIEHGCAYGPHGQNLIILNGSGNHFDPLKSLQIQALTVKANLEVRQLGFKPYIAPAISSAAYALKACLEGGWHHATLPFYGQNLGIKQRWTQEGIEIQRIPFNDQLIEWLETCLMALERDYETLPPL